MMDSISAVNFYFALRSNSEETRTFKEWQKVVRRQIAS